MLSALGGDQAAVLQHLSSVLWNNESLSDVTLKACGKTFHLHKILLLQSPKLKSAVENSPTAKAEVNWEISQEGVSADGLELALGSLYGRQPELAKENVKTILASAAYLELKELAGACIAHLISSIDKDTFFDVFDFANGWQGKEYAQELQTYCWKFLFRTAFREMRPQLNRLTLPQLERVFTADELWIPTELDRFRLIMEVLQPKLSESRDALSDVVVSDVLNVVVDQVSEVAMISPRHPVGESLEYRKGVKRATVLAGIGEGHDPKKQCYFEIRQPANSPTGHDGTDPALSEFSDDKSEGSFLSRTSLVSTGACLENGVFSPARRDLSNSFTLSDALSTESGVLCEAVASAAQIQKVLSNVLSGEEGLLYGSMGFGALLGVRGKLVELGLKDAEDALKEGLWEKGLLCSLITFYAFKNSELKSVESMYNAADLRVLAMNFQSEHEWVFSNEGVSLPRLRFSVEFENVASLGRRAKSDIRSEQIYFAGSLFRVVLTIHVDQDTREKTLGIFLHRSSDLANCFVDASGFVDPRSEIDAQITFIAGTGQMEVIELSGRIAPPHNNKGYSRFLPFSSIKDYLSPSGTLRVTVIITPLFESVDVKSPIYVKAGQ
ncbi:hypothetical protein BSKO_03560 [Bryopsis sp. KO-2023]|nr:hypothetical protein BSKO_03560 [Bryopsis sp. KO-2023]